MTAKRKGNEVDFMTSFDLNQTIGYRGSGHVQDIYCLTAATGDARSHLSQIRQRLWRKCLTHLLPSGGS